jgi:hypothetical protein
MGVAAVQEELVALQPVLTKTQVMTPSSHLMSCPC